MAAPETKTRRRRAAGRTPANGTVEVPKQDLKQLLDALRSARDGKTGARLQVEGNGLMGDVAKVYNELAERRESLTRELARVRKVVGREGRITERARLEGAKGSWAESVECVNSLIEDLVRPTIEVSRVLDAVAEATCHRRWRCRSRAAPSGASSAASARR